MATVISLDTASPPVPGGKYAVSLCSFLRPDNTTAYTALDVIMPAGADITAGSSSGALVFPGCGRSGAIRGVSVSNRLETDTIGPRVWLFDSEPTNFADNAAFALVAADMPKIVGIWEFVDGDKLLVGTLTNFYTASDIGNATSPRTDPVPYATANGKLYGLLQTLPGYTPVALTEWVIRVMVEHD
jgi:hypothetical protein